MPAFTLEGKPPKGIPFGSRVRIVALPNRSRVWTGEVDESITMNFHPGKYDYSVSNFTDDHFDDFKYSGTFLIGMTEEVYQRIKYMRPKFCKVMTVTDGTRYQCKHGTCTFKSMSMIAALIHENEHFGVDILKDPTAGRKADDAKKQYAKEVAASKGPSEGAKAMGKASVGKPGITMGG